MQSLLTILGSQNVIFYGLFLVSQESFRIGNRTLVFGFSKVPRTLVLVVERYCNVSLTYLLQYVSKSSSTHDPV